VISTYLIEPYFIEPNFVAAYFQILRLHRSGQRDQRTAWQYTGQVDPFQRKGWQSRASQMPASDHAVRHQDVERIRTAGLRLRDLPDGAAVRVAAFDAAVDCGAVEGSSLALAGDDTAGVAAAHFVGELEPGRLPPRIASTLHRGAVDGRFSSRGRRDRWACRRQPDSRNSTRRSRYKPFLVVS